MARSTFGTRTNGTNGIICSCSTNGWSSPVSPKRICVPSGTLTPACFAEHGRVLADEVLVDVQLAVVAHRRTRPSSAPRSATAFRRIAAVAGHRLPSACRRCRRRRRPASRRCRAGCCRTPPPAMIDCGGVLQAGRLVDDDRRIARPGDDRPPLARQGRPGHGGAAGDDQQPDAAVVEERRGRFERRRVDDREQVRRCRSPRGSPG